MYNRYIPEDISYTPIGPSGPDSGARRGTGPIHTPFRLQDIFQGRGGLTALLSGGSRGVSGLLKALHLEGIDAGDILLLLILLYLMAEGDDLELVIALGLVLLMGLGEDHSSSA